MFSRAIKHRVQTIDRDVRTHATDLDLEISGHEGAMAGHNGWLGLKKP